MSVSEDTPDLYDVYADNRSVSDPATQHTTGVYVWSSSESESYVVLVDPMGPVCRYGPPESISTDLSEGPSPVLQSQCL